MADHDTYQHNLRIAQCEAHLALLHAQTVIESECLTESDKRSLNNSLETLRKINRRLIRSLIPEV